MRFDVLKWERLRFELVAVFDPPQSGQVLDVLHRSGNVHDSKGALEFVSACVQTVRERLGNSVRLEARLDSAFFSDTMLQRLEQLDVEYNISVPFERFTALKGLIEKQGSCRTHGHEWFRCTCGRWAWFPESIWHE